MPDIKQLIRIIEQNFQELKPGSVQPHTRFDELLVWNSFNALLIYTIVKEEYGIELPWTDFKHLHTIGELHAHLLKLQQA